jgi:hypothetical protein
MPDDEQIFIDQRRTALAPPFVPPQPISQLLYRADAGLVPLAAPALAELLHKMARQAGFDEASLLMAEARYFDRKHADVSTQSLTRCRYLR